MITSPTDPSKKACEKCKCPLLLLRLEKRRWENRRICARCGEGGTRMAPMSLERLVSTASQRNGKASTRAMLRSLPVVEVTPKPKIPRDKVKRKVQSARPDGEA